MAPSPTGMLHVGTAHTTLFNYLFARHNGGSFILRIEDTDPERSEKRFEEDIIDGLRWFGIDWDGEVTRQSETGSTYKKYLEKMLQNGTAFYCPHPKEELEEERKTQIENKEPPKHVCNARDKNLEEGIIRFKNNQEEKIVFHDEIRGEISFDPKLLGDFSLARSLESALYHFAVVIDDAVMDITHVIRGEDHISNTPKHILIQRALNLPQVTYAHLPLLLGSDRSKLSKRHGATSVAEYRKDGYLPEAMLNFLALLGWNPGTEQEIFSKDELIKEFSLEKVQKAGAIFDVKKLDWMNGEYIRTKSTSELVDLATPFLLDVRRPNQLGRRTSKLKNIIELEQPRLKKLSELPEKIDYFFAEPKPSTDLLQWKSMTKEEIRKSLEKSKAILENFDADFTKENLEKIFLENTGKDRGELLWPLRVALSGKKASPGPFDIMAILGKDESIKRIQSSTLLWSGNLHGGF